MLIFNAFRRTISKAEILFALLAVAYLAPYLVGFLYGRHMVPVYFLASCTLAVQLNTYFTRPARSGSGNSDAFSEVSESRM